MFFLIKSASFIILDNADGFPELLDDGAQVDVDYDIRQMLMHNTRAKHLLSAEVLN